MGSGLPNFNIKKDLLTTAEASNLAVRDLAPSKNLKIGIIPTNEPSNPLLTTLLLNPESLTETKAANWIQHNIPGQSDPLMQWISGSARTVTFTAKITLDIAENFTVNAGSDADIWSLEIEPELANVGKVTDGYNAAILGQLYDVSSRSTDQDVNSLEEQGDLSNRSSTRWKQSIQPQLDYYRGLLVPRTGSLRNQVKTPPLVRLYMGDILGRSRYSANQDFILASYNFNILQTTPELLPTQADVTFTFIEYNDSGKSIKPVPPAQIDRNEPIRSNVGSPTVIPDTNLGGFDTSNLA